MSVVVILVAGWLLLLLVPAALLWGLCLLFREYGKWRDRMGRAFLAVLIAALLLFGGGWLLERLGLAWRVAAVRVLGAVLSLGVVAALVCLDGCLIEGPLAGRKGWRVPMVALSVPMSLVVLFAGFTYFGPAQDRERVILHDGEKVVEVENDLKDARFQYYKYHGPILRGSKPIHSAIGEGPWQRWEDEGK